MSSSPLSPPLIACVGDIDLDWLVSVDRLPSRDDKIGSQALERRPGGMAANVAATIAKLGARSRLIGAVGTDREGEEAIRHLSATGIDLGHVRRVRGATTFQCLVLVAPSGERALVRLPSPLIRPRAGDVRSEDLAGARHVHLTFGAAEVVADIARSARLAGLGVSLDLEADDCPTDPIDAATLLDAVDLLFVNRAARAALGRVADLKRLACTIVTTLGAEGACCDGPDGHLDSPGHPVDVVDTTGAGDAFAGAFLVHRLVDGAPIAEAMAFANVVAALSTRSLGAQTALPDRKEVLRVIADLRVGA